MIKLRVCSMEELPTELIIEIFCRIPLIAINRCKHVCKAWRNLLSDPNFIHIYSKNPPAITSVFFSARKHDYVSPRISLIQITENRECVQANFVPSHLPRYSADLYSHLYLVGSSNGLLCIYIRLWSMKGFIDRVYVINPINARETLMIPQRTTCYSTRSIPEYFFDFVPSTNNFKVLRIVRYEQHDGYSEAEIFTVGVDRDWRRLDGMTNPIDQLYVRSEGVVLNATYNCMINRRPLVSMYSLDIGEEKGREIAIPRDLRTVRSINIKLIALKNCLCIYDLSLLPNVTIWTMKEYGVVESWTKDIIVSMICFSDPGIFRNRDTYINLPTAILSNGDILVVEDGDLVFYDPYKQKRAGKFGVCGRNWKVLRVSAYVPCFSSFEDVLSLGDEDEEAARKLKKRKREEIEQLVRSALAS